LRVTIAEHIEAYDACQRYKDVGQVQGQVTPRNETAVPWSDVAVNLIGPWEVDVGQQQLVIQALTTINVATTLFEITRIKEKSSEHILMKFENSWLSW
jgi:hypothetical protein